MPEGEGDTENREIYPGTIQTAEILIFREKDGEREILLVEYQNGDRKGVLGIPGGRMRIGESLRETAARELLEELGIEIDEKELNERLKSFPDNYFTMNEFSMKDKTARQAAVTAYYLHGGIGDFEVTSREPEKLQPRWINVKELAGISIDQKMPNTDIAVSNCQEFIKSQK